MESDLLADLEAMVAGADQEKVAAVAATQKFLRDRVEAEAKKVADEAAAAALLEELQVQAAYENSDEYKAKVAADMYAEMMADMRARPAIQLSLADNTFCQIFMKTLTRFFW